MNVSQSRVAPHIQIKYETSDQYRKAENALSLINKHNSGKSLINEIRNNSIDGKSMIIDVDKFSMTTAYPKLTDSQIIKYNAPHGVFNKEHNILATELSNKKGFGRKGEGTSSFIVWNPSISVHVENGINVGVNDENESFISLAHEMIHGYRMMKGTYVVDGSNRHQTETKAAEEESRTVGIGSYSNKEISENTIRREHGLELRAKYKLDVNDFVIGM